MFGFSLTIYILTSVLGQNYPGLDPFTHANGHLWVAMAGGSPILFNIVHPLSNVLIFAGLIVISIGWRAVHSGNGHLITSGIYKYIRHPQYSGFMLAIIVFLIQSPTIVTLLLSPILMFIYVRLAKQEEKIMVEMFGNEYT